MVIVTGVKTRTYYLDKNFSGDLRPFCTLFISVNAVIRNVIERQRAAHIRRTDYERQFRLGHNLVWVGLY